MAKCGAAYRLNQYIFWKKFSAHENGKTNDESNDADNIRASLEVYRFRRKFSVYEVI